MKKFRAAIMDFRAALGLDPTNISARQYLETTIAQEEEHRLNVSQLAHIVVYIYVCVVTQLAEIMRCTS
jgi:cytochrome c-type biogenesis protein CcmH/NrfG